MKASDADGAASLEAWCGCDKYRRGREVDLHPQKPQKSRPTIGNGTPAQRKANMYSQPLNFTAVFTKFHILMACLFTACSLGPVCRGGGLERDQRKGGTGIHQKILVGHFVSYKAKLCMTRKHVNYCALWQS
jgi:hypothetical protein